ncbi:OmpW/AlkL family protein [Flavobacterium sp. RHBU_3]|uniref:OmpW/AlkL family protein n=1 Tax=Flavobacterium sp. RHBU_3 TaxID=3391184 RepID=UPI003984F4F8
MKKLSLAVAAIALFGFNTTQAQQQENTTTPDFYRWQVRMRAVGVIPAESANIGIIGGDAAISNSYIPELDFTYFFTKNIAAELILGTTKHDVHTTASDISAIGGPTSTDVNLGSVYLLPPTLTLQYHFNAGQAFKPYVGAGVNYTIFYNAEAGTTVKDVKYDNAFGYAFQLGFDYNINDRFFINVDAKKIFLKTDVTVDASNLATGLNIPASVDINPLLLGVGMGYRF